MITSELEKVEQRLDQVRLQQERIASPLPATTPRYSFPSTTAATTSQSSTTTTTTQTSHEPFPKATPFVHEPATTSGVSEDDYHLEGKHWHSVSPMLFESRNPINLQTEEHFESAPPKEVKTEAHVESESVKPVTASFQHHDFHCRTRQHPKEGGRRILIPLVPSFIYCRLFEWLNRTILSPTDLVDLISLHPVPSSGQMNAVMIPSDPHELYSPGMEPTLYAAVSSAFTNFTSGNVQVLITSKGALLQEELKRTDEYKPDLVVVPWGVAEVDVHALVNSCPVPLVIFK